MSDALRDSDPRWPLEDVPDEIETDRLVLRCPVIEDAEEVNALIRVSHAEIRQWLSWAVDVPSVDDTRRRVEETRASRHAGGEIVYRLTLKENRKIIGVAGVRPGNPRVRDAELGYWVGTAFTGRGYMAEAVTALVEQLCITILGVQRIEILTDVENTPSRRVAERCGFELEAIHRREMTNPQGDQRDSARYVRLV